MVYTERSKETQKKKYPFFALISKCELVYSGSFREHVGQCWYMLHSCSENPASPEQLEEDHWLVKRMTDWPASTSKLCLCTDFSSPSLYPDSRSAMIRRNLPHPVKFLLYYPGPNSPQYAPPPTSSTLQPLHTVPFNIPSPLCIHMHCLYSEPFFSTRYEKRFSCAGSPNKAQFFFQTRVLQIDFGSN
jgi:hypothetical protein